MKFRAKDWDFICTKRAEGTYDLLIFQPARKELFFEEFVNETYLSGVDSYGVPYQAVEIGPQTFDIIFDKLTAHLPYSEGFFFDWGEEGDHSNRVSEVSAQTIKRAIAGELPEEELDAIVQKRPEKGDYLDFAAFFSMLERFFRGEVSEGDFTDWLIVVSWALSRHPFKENSKRALFYEELADAFDGIAFVDFEQEPYELEEFFALLKFERHALKNLRRKKVPPFHNENGVAVFVCFAFANHYNAYYKVCVADPAQERFRVTQIANPQFLRSVNYTFCEDDEFDDLTNLYYDFYHDPHLPIDAYIGARPHFDIHGNTEAKID